jgi:hypothetical protein
MKEKGTQTQQGKHYTIYCSMLAAVVSLTYITMLGYLRMRQVTSIEKTSSVKGEAIILRADKEWILCPDVDELMSPETSLNTSNMVEYWCDAFQVAMMTATTCTSVDFAFRGQEN